MLHKIVRTGTRHMPGPK